MAGYEYQHEPYQSEMLCLHVAGIILIIHAKRGNPSDCVISNSQVGTEVPVDGRKKMSTENPPQPPHFKVLNVIIERLREKASVVSQ
jgi:hypothetical protein